MQYMIYIVSYILLFSSSFLFILIFPIESHRKKKILALNFFFFYHQKKKIFVDNFFFPTLKYPKVFQKMYKPVYNNKKLFSYNLKKNLKIKKKNC